MVRLVLKKVLSLSAIVACCFALLMLDTDSPSLVSEAEACDPVLYLVCYQNCGFACVSGLIMECPLGEQPCCEFYCTDVCEDAAGCP